MTEPIHDPLYWARRLTKAQGGPLHYSVFCCPTDRWHRIEEKHQQILARHVMFADSVLDAGCGYGRLLDLMPELWHGEYTGVDLSPDFINLARRLHEGRRFVVADLLGYATLDTTELPTKYDWAVLISVRPMVSRNTGVEAWETMERGLRKVASRLLYLEYDETDEGSVE